MDGHEEILFSFAEQILFCRGDIIYSKNVIKKQYSTMQWHFVVTHQLQKQMRDELFGAYKKDLYSPLRIRIYTQDKTIIESWSLCLYPDDHQDKKKTRKQVKFLILMRSLMSMLRLLPAYQLHLKNPKFLYFQLSFDRICETDSDKNFTIYQFQDTPTRNGFYRIQVNYRENILNLMKIVLFSNNTINESTPKIESLSRKLSSDAFMLPPPANSGRVSSNPMNIPQTSRKRDDDSSQDGGKQQSDSEVSSLGESYSNKLSVDYSYGDKFNYLKSSNSLIPKSLPNLPNSMSNSPIIQLSFENKLLYPGSVRQNSTINPTTGNFSSSFSPRTGPAPAFTNLRNFKSSNQYSPSPNSIPSPGLMDISITTKLRGGGVNVGMTNPISSSPPFAVGSLSSSSASTGVSPFFHGLAMPALGRSPPFSASTLIGIRNRTSSTSLASQHYPLSRTTSNNAFPWTLQPSELEKPFEIDNFSNKQNNCSPDDEEISGSSIPKSEDMELPFLVEMDEETSSSPIKNMVNNRASDLLGKQQGELGAFVRRCKLAGNLNAFLNSYGELKQLSIKDVELEIKKKISNS